MDGLDFSALSDDQLLTLIKASLQEAISRHPALGEAARAAMLDEQERLRILREAGEREAAALRAKEREKLAQEAAEQVRRRHAAEQAEIERARKAKAAEDAIAKAEEARRKAAEQEAIRQRWLERCAALVNVPARELSLVVYNGRALINRGGRYERHHLVDLNLANSAISTTRELIGKKPDLAALLAEYAAKNPGNRAIVGEEVFP
jgi:predicted ATP-dependent protease